MPVILIVYDSETGNTAKMAEIIAEGANEIEGVDVKIQRANETTNDNLLTADGIIVGSPTYYGTMSASIKELIDKSVKIHGKLDGKVGAAFTSSGGIATGAETTIMSIIQALLVHGMIVKGYARGPTVHYGAAAVGAPTAKEIKMCRALGKRTAELVSRLFG